jgi:hypothetical protein
MRSITAINLRTNQYNGKSVDQIELHTFDMWFYKDITCDRDIKLIGRLAKEHNLQIMDYRK